MRIQTPLRHGAVALLFTALLLLAPLASAQWTATVGGEDQTMGRQALAFLPNEIWIHAGDNVTWTLNADEPHTSRFLRQSRSGRHLLWDARDSRETRRRTTGQPA